MRGTYLFGLVTPTGGDCKGISSRCPNHSGLGIIVICPDNYNKPHCKLVEISPLNRGPKKPNLRKINYHEPPSSSSQTFVFLVTPGFVGCLFPSQKVSHFIGPCFFSAILWGFPRCHDDFSFGWSIFCSCWCCSHQLEWRFLVFVTSPRLFNSRSFTKFLQQEWLGWKLISALPVAKKMMDFYMDVSKNRGKTPQIIHFNRVFHYKPSILGYQSFWKHPYKNLFKKPSF